MPLPLSLNAEGIKLFVSTYQGQVLKKSLRCEYPVERIFMGLRILPGRTCMQAADREQLKPGLLNLSLKVLKQPLGLDQLSQSMLGGELETADS
jgi:hypothetical protein